MDETHDAEHGDNEMSRLLWRLLLMPAALAPLAAASVGCVSVGGHKPLVDIQVQRAPAQEPPPTYYMEPYPPDDSGQ